MSHGLARPQITQKSLRRPQKSTKDQKKGSWLVTDKMHAGSDLSKVADNGLQCLLCLPLMDLRGLGSAMRRHQLAMYQASKATLWKLYPPSSWQEESKQTLTI